MIVSKIRVLGQKKIEGAPNAPPPPPAKFGLKVFDVVTKQTV